MTARTVVGAVEFPDGSGAPCVGARVVAELYTGTDGLLAYGTANDVVVGVAATLTDNSGAWTLDLEPNVNITPAGTVWHVTATRPGAGVIVDSYISVPDSAGSHDFTDILAEQPGALPSQALTEHAALTAAHGVSGAVVGTTSSQTLTNKTLTDPVVSASASAALALRVALSTERAKRFDARDYGTFSSTPAASIQAACDAAASAGGGTVWVPNLGSAAVCSTAIVVSGDDITIESDGALLQNQQSADPVIQVTGDRCVVRGLRFTRTVAGTSDNHSVEFNGVLGGLMEGCVSTNAGVNGVYVANSTQVTLRDVTIDSATRIGVLVYGSTDVVLSGVRAYSCGLYGLQFKNCNGGLMYGCVVRDAAEYGFYVWDDETGDVRSVACTFLSCAESGSGKQGFFLYFGDNHRIEGCTSAGASFSGIEIGAGDGHVITGNRISGSSSHGLLAASSVSDVSISGNVVTGCAGGGIVLNGSARCVVVGNVVTDNATGSSSDSGIELRSPSSLNVVSANACVRTGSPSQQKYGIEERSGCDLNVLGGNVLSGNMTAGLLKTGSGSTSW